MPVAEQFIQLTTLLCEPARATMLWNLLDGRAYTASELAYAADISATSASNHLSRLLEADIVKVDVQGRHRYYSFSKPEVAYVIESLAMLANDHTRHTADNRTTPVKFCRTCYDHLAGYVGVQITEALEHKSIIKRSGTAYAVTDKGWKWLTQLEISKDDLTHARRPLTRQCLDWSERRPHLAGQLGALLLERMQQRKWFRKVQHSRALVLTSQGSQGLYKLLGLELSSK